MRLKRSTEESRLKTFVWIGLFVGSTVGGMVPELWGGSAFGGWSLVLSMLGGFAGIWGGYKLGRML